MDVSKKSRLPAEPDNIYRFTAAGDRLTYFVAMYLPDLSSVAHAITAVILWVIGVFALINRALRAIAKSGLLLTKVGQIWSFKKSY